MGFQALDTLAGKVKSRNVVDITIDNKYWKNDVVNVKMLGDRIIALKLIMERDILNYQCLCISCRLRRAP